MKILHTSDWHLGHNLYSYDRHEEQQCFLGQIADIVTENKPDVVVVSGDIFHNYNPSTEVQKMFVDSIVKIHESHPTTTIVITAGNHDSYSRLEVDKLLWQKHNVHVFGNIARNADQTADYAPHIIPIKPQEAVVGYVVAVPFSFPHNFPAVPDDNENSSDKSRQDFYFKNILRKANELNINNLPIVMMAHLTLSGCDTTGHDSDVTGGVDAVEIDRLGSGYDYLALGHIHRPQFVNNSDKVRYCGTPMPVSFSELFHHTVTLVDIDYHGDKPRCTEVKIHNPKPLITIPHTGTLTFDEALQKLQEFDSQRVAYIRLNVSVDAGQYIPPEAMERIREAIVGKKCKFCLVNRQENDKQNADNDGFKAYDIEQLQQLSTDNILNIVQQRGDLDDKETEMLKSVIEELRTENKL